MNQGKLRRFVTADLLFYFSDAGDESLSAHSSSASLFSLAAPQIRPLPPEVALYLDKLVQTASRASSGPDLNSKADMCYFTCLEYKKQVIELFPGFASV